jgi:DNA-binding SARP family transcriptional activator/DNA-binding beta-propeller fold protein YncE
VDFRVLGSLEVVENGEALRLGGLKQRGLLAILLLHANEMVPADRLIDELWGEHPPGTAANAVQVYISQLRKVIGAERLVHRGKGYELRLAREELDLHRFIDTVDEARRSLAVGEEETASSLLRDALLLWRGPALAEFAFEPFAQREIGHLEELRLAALEDRIDADLGRGRHAVLVGELEALVSEHPLRERLRGQLMLALYRAGRQAEALRAFQSARRTLDEELGLQPGPALRGLERLILTQDPTLDAEAGRPTVVTDQSGALTVPPPAQAPEERPRHGWSWPVLASVAFLILLGAGVGGFLVVRSSGSAAVEVLPNSAVRIDRRTNRITASVPVGVEPVDAKIVHGVLLVLNHDEDTISRIDVAEWRLLGTIAIGGRIVGFTTSPDWGWTLSEETRTISRIDPEANRVVERIAAPGRVGPETGLVFGDGGLWVVNGGSGLRLDPATGHVTQKLELDALNFGLVESGAVYSLQRGARAAIFDARTGRRTAVVKLPGQVTGADSDDQSFWLSIGASDEVVRVDRRTKRITARIPVGGSPGALAIGRDGIVWVANLGDATVSKVDGRTAEAIATIDLGRVPLGIAVTSAGTPWVIVYK